MKTAMKSAFAVAAATAAVAGAVATPMAASAFSRDTYSLQQINSGELGNKITFNSIIYNASTDEKWHDEGMLENETNFVGARKAGANLGYKNVWEGDTIDAEEGQEYLVRIYVHNNSPKGTAKTAENVKVLFYVPFAAGKTVTVDGWLTASNATPNTYLDDVVFKSTDGTPFHLEYVPGSALIENKGYASGNGQPLPDTVVSQANTSGDLAKSWTLIGYEKAFDGKIPGCYDYVSYITIKVKVVYDRDFLVEKKVRLAGETEWRDSVTANVGDEVEFLIQYLNTSKATQTGAAVKDILPDNLEYVPGSVKLKNATYPNSTKLMGDHLVSTGIEIGSYGKNANAYVTFSAKVTDDNLACGANTLVNWAQGQHDGSVRAIQDYAMVHVNKVCETPKTEEKMPSAGPTALVSGLMAAGATATAAGYYISSRRQLR